MTTLYQVLEVLGFLLRAIGFGLLGYGIVRFVLDSYGKAIWQLQAALALGLFALLVGLTAYTSPGSAGAFALGAGIALLRTFRPVIPEPARPEPK